MLGLDPEIHLSQQVSVQHLDGLLKRDWENCAMHLQYFDPDKTYCIRIASPSECNFCFCKLLIVNYLRIWHAKCYTVACGRHLPLNEGGREATQQKSQPICF